MPFGCRLRVSLLHQIAPGDRDAKEIPMNARSNLLTALLTLSLIVPAAAGAQIPGEPTTTTPKHSKVPAPLYTLKANSSTIGTSASNNWAAYVHGGASTKVAKAITAAAKTRTAARTASTCASDAQYRMPC